MTPVNLENAARQRENTRLSIDFMRGAFALMVLIGHSMEVTLIRFGLNDPSQLSKGSALTWLRLTIGSGSFWVGGFFILSGLCIQWSVLGAMKNRQGFFRSYLLARVTRIYPLYLLGLLLYLVTRLAMEAAGRPLEGAFPAGRFIGHVFMLQGITGVIGALSPAWSLTYEAFYYLLWPALLFLTAFRPNRAVAYGAAFCLATGALVAVYWKKWQGGATDSPLIPIWLILVSFIPWAGGAWLATNWQAVAKRVGFREGMICLIGVVAAYFLNAWLGLFSARQWVFVMLSFLALPFWLGLLAHTPRWNIPKRLGATARFFGVLSYPLYLFHRLFLDAFSRCLPASQSGWFDTPLTFFLISTVFALAACIVIGMPFETAILRWRDRLLRHQDTTKR